jgi:hypothetical protein
MKLFTLSFFLITSFCFAGNHAEGQQAYLKKESDNYKTKYNCEMEWILEASKAKMENNLEATAFMRVFSEVEYPVRLKCQKGGFDKFNKVIFVPGSVAADYKKCTPEQNKDSAVVKQIGKTVTVTCKYVNCYCAGDTAEEAVISLLK